MTVRLTGSAREPHVDTGNFSGALACLLGVHPIELGTLVVAGLLTFLSPCVLPLVPTYLALLGGASAQEVEAGSNRGRLLRSAAAFWLGLSAVFVLLGMGAGAASTLLAAHRKVVMQVGGVVVLIVGLRFVGLIAIPVMEREVRPGLQRVRNLSGPLGAFLFGGAFALGWTPCVGPVLGSVLTWVAGRGADPLRGGIYLSAYAAGIGIPLVVAALVAPWALAWLRRTRRRVMLYQRVAGALLVVVGGMLVTDNLQRVAELAPEPPLELAGAAAPHPADAVDSGKPAVCDVEHGLCQVEAPPAWMAPVAGKIAGPALVEFASPTCPVCQKMAPRLERLEHACHDVGIHFVRVDVSTPDGRSVAAAHRIRGVPSLLMLNGAGEEQVRLVGEQPKETLLAAVGEVSPARCERLR